MPAVDPSLLTPSVQYNPTGEMAKALTMKDLTQNLQLNDIKLQQEQKDIDENRKIQDIAGKIDWTNPESTQKGLGDIQKISAPKAMELERARSAAATGNIAMEREQIALTRDRFSLIGSASDAAVTAYDKAYAALMAQAKNPTDPTTVKAIRASAGMAAAPILQQQMNLLSDSKDSKGNPLIPQQILQATTQQMGKQPIEDFIDKTLRPYAEQMPAHIVAQERALKERNVMSEIEHRTTEEKQGAAREAETHRHNVATESGGFGGGTQEDQSRIRSTMGYLAELNVNLPTGMRSQKQIAATVKGLIENHPDLSPRDLAGLVKQGVIDLTGEKREAATAGNIAGKIAYAEQEIQRLVPIVEKASAEVPRGSFVPWNRLSQYTAKQLSDPKLKALYSYMNTLSNAYDMLAARGGTDMEKRAHNRALFDAADSPEALEAALDAVVTEAKVSQEAAQATLGHGAAPPAAADDGWTVKKVP